MRPAEISIMAEAICARALEEADARLRKSVAEAIKKIGALAVYKNLKESVYRAELSVAKMTLQFTKFHNRTVEKQLELLQTLVYRMTEGGVNRLELRRIIE